MAQDFLRRRARGSRVFAWAGVVAIAGSSAGASGCGYLLYGEKQRIVITGPPPGSLVTDGHGQILGEAPGELRVPHHQNFMLFINKPGHREGRVFLERRSGWGILLLDLLLTAGIGLIVDLKKGTWAAFDPSEYHIEMPAQEPPNVK